MTDLDSTKVCSKCHLELSLTAFHKQRKTVDGLRPDCKECRKAESTSYYQKNKARIVQAVNNRANSNRDRITSYLRQWYQLNKESVIQKQRDYHRSNKSACNQRSRDYRIRHLDALRAKRKLYEQANPDIIRFHKSQHEARKRNAQGICTSEQWREKCRYHGWQCIYCHAQITPESVTIEHRKPLSRGGSNWPANLAPCCRQCNQSKNCKTEPEYRAYICFQKLNTVSVLARDVMP